MKVDTDAPAGATGLGIPICENFFQCIGSHTLTVHRDADRFYLIGLRGRQSRDIRPLFRKNELSRIAERRQAFSPAVSVAGMEEDSSLSVEGLENGLREFADEILQRDVALSVRILESLRKLDFDWILFVILDDHGFR